MGKLSEFPLWRRVLRFFSKATALRYPIGDGANSTRLTKHRSDFTIGIIAAHAMSTPTITSVLQHLEATEANLAKLERLCADISRLIPSGISFGSNPDYEEKCRAATEILKQLPAIDGWKPDLAFQDLDDIAQNRFDAMEIDEPTAQIAVERGLEEPERELRNYRFRFNRKRRELLRDALKETIAKIDDNLRVARAAVKKGAQPSDAMKGAAWDELKVHVKQIDTLLGSVPRPARWTDLNRHLYFGMVGDLTDIEKHDWPNVRAGIEKGMFGEDEAVPTGIDDLSELVGIKPAGPIPTRLHWEKLDDEAFERLIFALVSGEDGYENPEWLMRTRATDRGRDVSVYLTQNDPLMGSRRRRVIIQCKHWLSKSIGMAEISTLKEQMKLWDNPRVDILIIATSGRFSSDAISYIEKHNNDGNALSIVPWSESHLEKLLAERPALIAEFHLR